LEGFADFLVNNYIWFLIVAVILIFALIGYLVDTSGDTPALNNEKEPKQEKKSLFVSRKEQKPVEKVEFINNQNTNDTKEQTIEVLTNEVPKVAENQAETLNTKEEVPVVEPEIKEEVIVVVEKTVSEPQIESTNQIVEATSADEVDFAAAFEENETSKGFEIVD